MAYQLNKGGWMRTEIHVIKEDDRKFVVKRIEMTPDSIKSTTLYEDKNWLEANYQAKQKAMPQELVKEHWEPLKYDRD